VGGARPPGLQAARVQYLLSMDASTQGRVLWLKKDFFLSRMVWRQGEERLWYQTHQFLWPATRGSVPTGRSNLGGSSFRKLSSSLLCCTLNKGVKHSAWNVLCI
jgi:hypothetical protein